MSKGRGDEESAASSEGFKDGREDEEEREASESTTLYEGRGTRDDFLEEAESAGLCRATGVRVDFPCAGPLVGLIIVMGDWVHQEKPSLLTGNTETYCVKIRAN